jgi:hypothetical protein
MFSLGMKTTDQKEAAICTRHTFWGVHQFCHHASQVSFSSPILSPATEYNPVENVNSIAFAS